MSVKNEHNSKIVDFKTLNPFPHYYIYPMKKGQRGIELNGNTQPIQAGSDTKFHLFATSEWAYTANDENFTGVDHTQAIRNRMIRNYPHMITGKWEVDCLSDANLSLEELNALKQICEDENSMVSQMKEGDREALKSTILEMITPPPLAIRIRGNSDRYYGNPNGLYVKVDRNTLKHLLAEVNKRGCGGNYRHLPKSRREGGVDYCYMSVKNEHNSKIVDFKTLNPFPHYYIYPMKKGQRGIELNGNTQPIQAGSDTKFHLFATSEWAYTANDENFTGVDHTQAIRNRMIRNYPHMITGKWEVDCLSDGNLCLQELNALKRSYMVSQMKEGDREALRSSIREQTRIQQRRELGRSEL